MRKLYSIIKTIQVKEKVLKCHAFLLIFKQVKYEISMQEEKWRLRGAVASYNTQQGNNWKAT